MEILDSRVLLALIAKAETVFAGANKTLAFPLVPPVFTAEQLDFALGGKSAEELRQTWRGLADFSRLANLIPRGCIWDSARSEVTLPSTVRAILGDSRVADGEWSAAERASLAAAEALLYTPAADGERIRTPLYSGYLEYRDRWMLLQQRYRAEQLSATLGGDAATARKWSDEIEPSLRGEIERAEQDWSALGGRGEVERALATIAALGASPSREHWQKWEADSRPGGLLVPTGDDQAPIWPAYLLPANAASSGWQRMRLSPIETLTLAQRAPAEIRDRIGGGLLGDVVSEMEMEFSTAGLVRPWFAPALFAARFWQPRSPDTPPVSSGPPASTGTCPRYATGVVLCRNISARIPRDTIAEFYRSPRLQAVSAPRAGGLREMPELELAARAPRAAEPQFFRAAPSDPWDTPRKFVLPFPQPKGDVPRAVIDADELRRLLARQGFKPAPTVRRPVVTDDSIQITTNPNAIYLLAFICSNVPKCPNPDPDLPWSD